MYQTKEIVQEIKRVVRRRKKLLIIIPIFFVAISAGALYLIQPKYKSSISILVQKEETLNPLVLYEMAVNIASEDRLKSFNEILYSRSTTEMLIDSLNLDKSVKTEADKQNLVNTIRQNIGTSSRASDSFEITYLDTDPVRAKEGVTLLANNFIKTRLKLENRRNSETVNFFQDKLGDLEKIVDKQRGEIINETSQQMKQTPIANEALQTRLQQVESQMDDLDWNISQEEKKLEILNDFNKQKGDQFDVKPLYKLSLAQLPFGSDLLALLGEYDNLKQKFTENYPKLRSIRSQIVEVAGRIPPAMNSDLSNLKLQRKDLSDQRSKIINDMEKSFIATQRNNSKESDYSIYQKLYGEMKVKLEQARMTRDIGDQASEQFIVLDPPFIPEKPTSPNKILVLGLGVFLGVLMGVVAVAVAEALDNTIRTEEDLEINKPIIAYITDGRV